MPRFHPAEVPADAPWSEKKVRNALAALDGQWDVFHSVAWQAPRAGREGDGEADFVLLHPRHGLLVLEVKGGRIEVDEGQWSSIDRNGIRHTIKDPFRQATASKHALLRYLRDVRELEFVPDIHHAVVFPDVVLSQAIGLNPRDIVIDAADLTDVEAALGRVFRHWNGNPRTLSGSATQVIVKLLAPTIRVAGLLRSGIALAERQILTLTARQVDTMAMLRSVRRCVVRGGAGTGKSLLAAAAARRLSAEGAKVLLVSFNAPVAAQLSKTLNDVPGVTATTFHALCMRLGRATGQDLPRSPDDSWFATRAAEVLIAASSSTDGDERFDALLVDEAQDLSDDWLTALLLLLRDPDNGPVTLFLDNHQQIYRTVLTVPPWPIVELDRNCRNALPIARTVAACFGDPVPTEGADGPDISFVEADEGLLIQTIHDVVRRLLVDEQLPPEHVTVLTNTRIVLSKLRTMLVGPVAFIEAGGALGVATETIHRFKGLESPAVLLALSGVPARHEDSHDRALMYVGLSRARSALFVVASKQWLHWCKALAAR